MSEDRPPYGRLETGDDLIRTSVMQDEDTGECWVVEHDLKRGEDKKVATFHPQKRTVTVESGDLAVRDLAQVRAMIYAQAIEALVNQGQVDLG